MSNFKKLKTKRQTQPTKNPIMLSIKQKCKRKKKKKMPIMRSCPIKKTKKPKKETKAARGDKRKEASHEQFCPIFAPFCLQFGEIVFW